MTQKTKLKNKIGFNEAFLIVASVFIFILLMKNSKLVSAEASNALKKCATLLIPSLFPLTVASELLTSSGALEKISVKLQSIISKIFGIAKPSSAPYFLGVLGGYTSSCKSAVILYENGEISKEDCESIISISNMPSLAFITGFVGPEILNSTSDGWILWMISVISTFILGVFNRFFRKSATLPHAKATLINSKAKKKKPSKQIVDAISHSAHAMLIICACVVFFSVLIKVLEYALLSFEIPLEIQKIMLGSLEITHGISICQGIDNELLKRVLCAFFIGWSGLCVHFQVIALCDNSDISFKKYFTFKAIQGLICSILALIVF
jgi:sporulation integral membrane protein YlbJ